MQISDSRDELSVEELTRPRTASVLSEWAAATIERIGSTDAGKTEIRMRRGLAKQLVEEIYPLAVVGYSRKAFEVFELGSSAR